MQNIALQWLSNGDNYQKNCLKVIQESFLLKTLKAYNPIVAGTIPLRVYIESSDIDIIFDATDLEEFQLFAHRAISQLGATMLNENLSKERFVTSFEYKQFVFELYCTNTDSSKQNGYRHMLIEKRILDLTDANFKENIIKLKLEGYKTEPAFGYLLHLENPYSDLLTFEKMNDHELIAFIQSNSIKYGL